jgi:hypothetical protein
MAKLSTFMAGVVTGLTAAAIGQELAKPPAERTWRGKVAGVPYNFCLEDWPEIAREYWNPESNRIFSPHAIGLGWGVNLAAVVRRVRELMPAEIQAPSQDDTQTQTGERVPR